MKNYIQSFFVNNTPNTLVLILPGGAYEYTSKREAVPVAKLINEFGYHAAVFYYREEKLKASAMLDEATKIVSEFAANPLIKNLIVMGFSAGGHLAGLLAVKLNEVFAGLVMCYPVVSTNENLIHRKSFENMLEKDDYLDNYSIEKLIDKKMMPTFIWHTADDNSVLVDHSILMYEALKKYHTQVELHIFPTGKHGLSIVKKETAFDGADINMYLDENKHVAIWTTLLKNWLEQFND